MNEMKEQFPSAARVIIDEREFPNLGEVKRSPPPNPAASMSSSKSSKSKSATAESSKANSEAGSVDAAGEFLEGSTLRTFVDFYLVALKIW